MSASSTDSNSAQGSRALRVAVQMDAMDSIDLSSDSSFALMFAAQKRGYRLWHYDVQMLTWQAGRLTALAHPLYDLCYPDAEALDTSALSADVANGNANSAQSYRFGAPQCLDLGADVDVVLMRQDPPYDIGYLTGCWLLERIAAQTLVVNDPTAVRDAPEKVFVLDFAEYMPPTLISRSLEEVRQFHQRHGALVIKPLHGNGGKAVFKVDESGSNLSALVDLFGVVWREPFMVQPFLPEVAQGDKRIILVDGEVAGAINRKPGAGEFRSNLAAGGYAEATVLTEREREICTALAPELKRRGLVFAGIDVIGGRWLTEINVTSPTGIRAIDRFNKSDIAAMIWNAIERRLQTRAS